MPRFSRVAMSVILVGSVAFPLMTSCAAYAQGWRHGGYGYGGGYGYRGGYGHRGG